jgi:hypothetical protein
LTSQKITAGPLVEYKKTELNLAEKKLKLSEKHREDLDDKKIKNLKTNAQRFQADLFYINLIFNNASEIKMLLDQVHKISAVALKNILHERKIDGPYTPKSVEMFSFIEKNTREHEIIIFNKPRVIGLFSHRPSVMEWNRARSGYLVSTGS